MDSAGRDFAVLVGLSVTFVAYGVCGLVVYALVPLLGGGGPGASPVAGAVAFGLLVALAVASLARGAQAARRHRAANVRLVRWVERAAIVPAEELRGAAREAGLEGRIVLVGRPEVFSFVYGLFVPRVALSAGMLARLSAAELRAALEHERYHVRNLDPLRELVGRMLAEALFFLPLASALHRRYVSERELAADWRAVSVCGRRPLAGALLAVLEGVEPMPPAAVGLSGSALLASRLAQLETGRPAAAAAIDGRAALWSMLGLAAILALFVGAVYGVGGAAGLTHFLAAELAPANLLAGIAVCVAPVLSLAGLGYGRLVWGARGSLATR